MAFTASFIARSLIPFGLTAGLLLAGCDRQSPPPVQANATTVAQDGDVSPDEVQPAAAGPALPGAGVSEPDFSHKGEAPPALRFRDPAGRPVTLASFKGKPLLVNLWATWCGPCVAEMPTLDALAARGAGRLQVVAVNQDSEDPDGKVGRFFAERGLKTLRLYRDPELGLSVAYRANLPTTILYGADGRERWRVLGKLDWTGAEAAKLLAI